MPDDDDDDDDDAMANVLTFFRVRKRLRWLLSVRLRAIEADLLADCWVRHIWRVLETVYKTQCCRNYFCCCCSSAATEFKANISINNMMLKKVFPFGFPTSPSRAHRQNLEMSCLPGVRFNFLSVVERMKWRLLSEVLVVSVIEPHKILPSGCCRADSLSWAG